MLNGEGLVPTTAKSLVQTNAELASAFDVVHLGDLCDGLLQQIADRPHQYKDQANPPQRIGRIKNAFGSRIAAGIKPWEIADWLEGLKKAPATRNRYKAVFSAIYAYGKERDLVSVNPVRDVKQQKVSNGVVRYLDATEETRLRKVLQADVDACGPQNERRRKHLMHRIYELDVALGTGMRKTEQYGLTWDRVNLDRCEIVLGETKNGSARTVEMIDDVIAAMRGLQAIPIARKPRSRDRPNQAASNVVFSIGDNKRWFAAALLKARIKNFRWHDCRHTFCSRLAQSGASLKVIQEAAGHKTIQMAARYAHLDKTTLRATMAVLNRPK